MKTLRQTLSAAWQRLKKTEGRGDQDISLTLELLLPVSQLYGFESRYLQEKQRYQRG